MDHLYIGRQAIYDGAFNLYGYELLYRTDTLNQAFFEEGHLASSHVILTTFLDIGLERLVGSSRAFINLTRDFIDGALPVPVAPQQVVLELIEEIEPCEAVVNGLRELVNRGYTIAIDDALLGSGNDALLALAHIVKIDTLNHDREGLKTLCEKLRAYPVKLLAEKIESEAMLHYCQSLGFDYFQGFHLHRPEIITGRQLPNNALVIQQLLRKLQEPQADLRELIQLITLDVTLSYQLLRYLNCASYTLRQEIDSVAQAIQLLGQTALHQWVKLIELKHYQRAQPHELLTLGLVRARMCECLAKQYPEISAEQAFTVGQLSVLDKLLQTPLPELLDDVPLTMAVKLAVLERHGPLGELLAHCTACEQVADVPTTPQRLPQSQIAQCHHDATQWADTHLKPILC